MKIGLISFIILITNLGYSQSWEDTIQKKLQQFKTVQLTADLSQFNAKQKMGLLMLIHAAQQADMIFRNQSNPQHLWVDTFRQKSVRQFVNLNYGPWERLNNDLPFIKGVPAKPLGANFYPTDMRKGEFDSLQNPLKNNPYTVIERDTNGKLIVIPYSEKYYSNIFNISNLLKEAGKNLEDTILEKYLIQRAEDLLTDNYTKSDIAWLKMEKNIVDIIIGPIENYEDKLYGTKTAFESYVLIKDINWSKKLSKYVSYLPELQKNLPVDAKYKAETPGSNSQLNAYDAIYYAGDCNSGSKTIAVNLPNDEEIQLNYGTRRSQIKNVMKAKFDNIMLPISEELIDPSQRKHITFDAFFTNTMFHEVAHGLGIKNTINNKGTVREALGPYYSAIEEGKADILGLYMVTELFNKKVLKEGQLMDYYVTFMAGIFRSVRFGASSAHGQANMIRFNFFKEYGAFEKDLTTGFYKINMTKMSLAMNELSKLLLKLQGEGDLEAVKKLIKEKAIISDDLKLDLDKLNNKSIPVDIIFEQGPELLGLIPKN